MGVCRFCGKERTLIRAHIIPESFFRPLRDPSGPPRLMTDTKGIYPKRFPIGVYDKGILCRECEDRFAATDDYGQLLLLRSLSEAEPITQEGKTIALVFKRFDYTKLKLFVLSVLWRASVSRHPFYEKIALGPYEDRIREMFERGDPGPPDDFAVTFAHFEEKLGLLPFDPYREKYDGINYCRMYMGGYVVLVKVDHRNAPAPIGELALGKTPELYVISREFRNSQEVNVAKNIIKKARR